MMSQPLLCPIKSALNRFTHFARIASCGALLMGQPASAQNQPVLISQLVPIDGESGDIVYADRVAVPGMSAVVLYNRAHRFLVHTMHPGSLVPIAHPAKHHLSQCGIVSLSNNTAGTPLSQDYRVTVEVRVKAGRYRYRLSQFRAHPYGQGPGIALRDLYPCDPHTYDYSATQAQPLRNWHRSVQAYIVQLHRHMAGLEPGLPPL